MAVSMADIRRLLGRARADERAQVATLLGMEMGLGSPMSQAEQLVRQLSWKYQTPFGYLARDPTFDEIAKDVAKRLHVKVVAAATCWENLARILDHLWTRMFDEMAVDDRRKLVEELAGDGREHLAGMRPSAWRKLSAAMALGLIRQYGGPATNNVALIVTNQVAKALLGRGLTLAATRAIGVLLGPVGWMLVLWGLNDLFGTNYKRLVPVVLYIHCIHERLHPETRG